MRKFIIVIFLFLYIHINGQKDIKILSSSSSSLIIEYNPVYLDKSEILLDNNNYVNIELLNGIDSQGEVGVPVIPMRAFNIGVPNEFGNNIQIVSSKYETIKGKLKPQPNVRKINNFPSFEYLENEKYNKFSNTELVTFGDYGLIRDLKAQSINIHPVQFNPISQEIKIFTKIVFQINFGTQSKLDKIRKSELTDDVVLNFEIAKKWGNEKKLSKKAVIQSSVLATGDWYRFEVPQEGIYKIDRSFLSNLGIEVNSLDPRTIKIYNNGGYNLSWNPNEVRTNDLVENAIFIDGESDGSLDNNDYILFYGRGVDFWEYNNVANKITRNRHFYSKQNYYWFTYGGVSGKRMEVQANLNSLPDLVQTTTKAYKFQDNNKQNLMGSGLLYVDDDYTSSHKSNTYIHPLDELVAGSTINYKFSFVNGSERSNQLTIDENGSRIFNRNLPGKTGSNVEYKYGRIFPGSTTYSGSLPDNRSILKFSFSPSSISDKGHLDYLEIKYEKHLLATNGEIIFFTELVDGILENSVSQFSNSNIKIFNVTNYSNTKIVETTINGGGFTFRSQESSDSISKYYALHSNNYKIPQNVLKIENSNIRGFTPGAKYLIITHKDFIEQAEKLKNYRSNEARSTISTQIVLVDKIYNEFSCGMLDPTAIRDYLKYAYDNWDIKPEYVLLLGDGDYDYFNTEGKNLNFIPTFQTSESLDELSSYPYDDYYSRISGFDDKADIAIGRLCVTSSLEAEVVVNKIITYETKQNKGLWRNKITLLADDGWTPEKDDRALHTNQSESLARDYIPSSFNLNKIYLSNYQTEQTGLGRRKPDCNTAIIDAINNGTLIFNYVGHGNPDVWAHEIVFNRSTSLPQLRNEEFFFLTAATCDFGKYDDPNVQSATEEMILMENAGMIGGISAVRPVYAGENHALNVRFYEHMLQDKDTNGLIIPIGKVYHRLKNVRSSDNDEKFHLFADPLLRLNIPQLPVEITTINDKTLIGTVDIKALSRVTIKGRVQNLNNSNSQFDGEGIITVFDSKKIIHLDDINYNMEDQGGVIFRGRVSVENGEFSTSFTVPKDISYENKNGKIIAYLFNDEIDGVGFTNNIIVGGTDSSNTNDGKGPSIEILYDDESESSYLVGPNFKLRVKLHDETGLNTTGTGIGHKLEAILNDDEKNSIDLTNYFIGDLNSGGKSGEVVFKFSSLEPGEYKIKVNAWDVYNNFSSQENYFTVVDENDFVIREVYNYPNPFSSNTYFTFQHNLNSEVNVKIKIFTIAGRIIKEIESFNIEEKFVKIEWNGLDNDNSKIGNGTYLYKLIVETVNGEYKENILGKMAVIR